MIHPHAADIAQTLVDWFTRYGKDYPWRRTTDPWAILVSEIMLQQTTIPTVLARYEAWMQQYPTPAHLAAATEEEALRSWEGLGYYRRVRALQAAARVIVEKFEGIFPDSATDILTLPGVGEYTVGAILSFAWNRPAPLVDANVSRVFARLCNDATPIDSPQGKREQWEMAAAMVHQDNPRAYNSALMELGQTICTHSEPSCIICPVRKYCLAEDPSSLPVKMPTKAVTTMAHHDIWVVSNQGILLEKQAEGTRHAGMYRLPQRPESEVRHLPHLCNQQYNVTRYKVTRSLYLADAAHTTPLPGEEYVPLSSLDAIPIASPDRKLIIRFLEKAAD
ncbi:MAG: A/G-specific adenine glycosylase [Akkermansia sp.]|nr:A/G-specific adenine glycosylase [Akkermansia sp.]